MKQPRFDWRIVLVRPRNPLNIGAAARAMANFGFRDLVVVKPYDPVWQETRSASEGAVARGEAQRARIGAVEFRVRRNFHRIGEKDAGFRMRFSCVMMSGCTFFR